MAQDIYRIVAEGVLGPRLSAFEVFGISDVLGADRESDLHDAMENDEEMVLIWNALLKCGQCQTGGSHRPHLSRSARLHPWTVEDLACEFVFETRWACAYHRVQDAPDSYEQEGSQRLSY